MAEVLKINQAALILRSSEEISRRDYEKYLKFLSRRLEGESIAYILGRKEFRLLEFSVNPNVLVPRPDTETLVEAALSYIDSSIEQGELEMSVLDLCTGSGAIAISLKYERPHLRISASDISSAALKTAEGNSKRLLKGISPGSPIKFIESDLFKNIPIDNKGKFNIIISNPPYIPSSVLKTLAAEVRKEPPLALDGGKDGLKYIKKIIPMAKKHLLPKGLLLLEADPAQMPEVCTILNKNSYSDIKTHKDLSGQERSISASFRF